jgi:hypothetical protein
MLNFYSICINATNPCYLPQISLVGQHKYYTTLPHSPTISLVIRQNRRAPCLNPKGTLRTAERKGKTFIINHHQPASQIGTVNPKICYTNSLLIPPWMGWKRLCCALYAIELNKTFVRLLLWYATKSYVRREMFQGRFGLYSWPSVS